VRDHKPKNSDIIGVDFVHADLDPKDDETPEEAKRYTKVRGVRQEVTGGIVDPATG
jgi:hypothetical protein